MIRSALNRTAVAALSLSVFAAAADARSPREPDRPPLPRTAPSEPAVDRHLDRLPADFQPQVWVDPPPRPALEGPLAVNDQLTRARIFGEQRLPGAEDVAPGLDGHLYTGTADGRLLRYEPRTGRTSVVADGLYFANGVQVTPDERYAIVAESFRFRLTRVRLDGPGAGARTQFGPSLINGPDNIHVDDRGRVWVGGSDLRTDLVDAVLTSADLRRQLAAAPPDQRAAARPPYGFAQVLDRSGRPIHSFHDTTGRYFAVSAVLPHGDYLTFGSLGDRGIAQLQIPASLRKD